jgi:AraC family transcriptional regulator
VPHARKGLALDRTETVAQRNTGFEQEGICDLFDDVTDLGPPSSPAPAAHRFAATGLRDTSRSIIEVGLEAGFQNPSHFARMFRKFVGASPSQFQLEMKSHKRPL